MIKQTQLSFKLGMTEEEITPRSGLSVYAEFLRGFGIEELIDGHMPLPGSNRGYRAWQYIEPIMMMLYGGGRHIDDLREIVNDKALRRLIGLKDYAVKELIRGIGDWQPFHTEEGEETDREIAETVHTMNGTEKAFRLVVLSVEEHVGRFISL